MEKNYYYVWYLTKAIGHNGTSYTEITEGIVQAEIISEDEAKK